MWPRYRCLLFVTVSTIYVLLVFVLHLHLRGFDVPDVSSTENGSPPVGDHGQEALFIHTDIDDRTTLEFPVVRRCVGPAVDASPSQLRPLGIDWLYTAYFDDRLRSAPDSVDGGYIRVLALLRRRIGFDKPTFYIRWKANATSAQDKAELYEMCENHGRKYGGWIASRRYTDPLPPCSVVVSLHVNDVTPNTQIRLPVFRMSDESAYPMSTRLSLLFRRSVDERESKGLNRFAVCVPPLYGAVTAASLVQFVELTRLLGAQHFVFYVSDVSLSARRTLMNYVDDGIATMIAWNLPPVAAQSIWYNGQLLATNDCLYRTAHAFQYVAFNDLDEFIVPHSAANWSLMLAQLTADIDRRRRQAEEKVSESAASDLGRLLLRWLGVTLGGLVQSSSDLRRLNDFNANQSTVCGYTFRSAFFQSMPFSFQPRSMSSSIFNNETDFEFYETSYDVTTVHRSAFSRVRTKVMVRPSAVFELGIHHVSRPLYSLPTAVASVAADVTVPALLPTEVSSQVVTVQPEVGFVHHYRDCTNDYEYELDCNMATFVADSRLLDAGYIPVLRQRVRQRLIALRSPTRTSPEIVLRPPTT